MNLYLVQRPKRGVGYDEYDGFVIAAPTNRHARRIAAQADDSGFDGWYDTTKTTCKKIGEAKTGMIAGVVLDSFNAG